MDSTWRLPEATWASSLPWLSQGLPRLPVELWRYGQSTAATRHRLGLRGIVEFRLTILHVFVYVAADIVKTTTVRFYHAAFASCPGRLLVLHSGLLPFEARQARSRRIQDLWISDALPNGVTPQRPRFRKAPTLRDKASWTSGSCCAFGPPRGFFFLLGFFALIVLSRNEKIAYRPRYPSGSLQSLSPSQSTHGGALREDFHVPQAYTKPMPIHSSFHS